jgi:hypothetical protein
MSNRTGVVCGFGDVNEGLGGLAWDLGEPGAVLLSDGEARPASFAIEEGGDAAALEITAAEASLEATLVPVTAEIALGGGVIGTVCHAEARSEGGGRTVRCSGQICRWSTGPLSGAATFRQIAIETGDDSFLIVVASGEPGAAGHGDEQTSSWRIQDEHATAFEESLISTQYDGSSDPTRIGLELWATGDDQTSRAAATRVAGSLLGGARIGGAWGGFFRCHTDGAEGLGTYVLWRA